MGTAGPAHPYRPEIDGLRAVAVVPVVLFHAGFEAFGGGFVGVDVFFVISGYLITSILLADKQAGRFSFAGFYERRARRILPALFIVLAASSAVAWVYLLPSEMKSFGQGVSAAAAFAANVFFFVKGGDYFGLESAANPLLHLWSLGVEEQYYLIFPLLLALALRLGRSGAAAALAVAAFLSLAAAHASSIGHPAAAFYLLPTRGWELIAGCLLALRAPSDALPRDKVTDDRLALLGALLLGCAIAGFDRSLPFPSLYTVIPVAGTALIIAFASPETRVGRLLGSPPLVAIGLVSYGAYLWHQPLLAFAHVIADAEPDALARGLLAAASFPLAYLTWRFVETPCRTDRRVPGSAVFAMSAAGSLTFFTFGVVGHYNNGYPERSPLYRALASNFGLSPACNGNHSVIQDCATSTTPQIAVWGDSYAMHLVDGIVATHPAAGLVQLTRDSCPPHGSPPGSACGDFHDRSMQTLLNTPSLNTIVMSSRFENIAEPRNAAALERTIAMLKSTGKQVVVVGPTPASGTNFARCFARQKDIGRLAACNFDRRSILPRHSAAVTTLRDIASRAGAQFVDLTDVICGTTTCRTSADTVLIYRDGGHLSRDGSRHVMGILHRDRRIDLGEDTATLTRVRH